MNQADRDRLFSMMVFWDNLNTWVEDETSELKIKDKNKLKIIKDNVMAMLVQYRKMEGVEALNNLMEESKKYKFGIMPKDEKTELIGMESIMLKNAIERVLKTQTNCECCSKCDYKYCEWYALQKFLGKEGKYKKKQCPYKTDLNDIFENLSENL